MRYIDSKRSNDMMYMEPNEKLHMLCNQVLWEVIYACFYNWDGSPYLVLIMYGLVELIIEASHIGIVQSHIGGVREGRCLNTTAFPADMRCLTTIMMFCNDPAPTVYILSTLGPRTPHGFVLEIFLQSHSSLNWLCIIINPWCNQMVLKSLIQPLLKSACFLRLSKDQVGSKVR